MEKGTFGRAYADFMGSRGFEADQRPPTRFVDDAELAYVATRYREVHDLWHVLFRCPTTVSGELALKAVEFFQVRWHKHFLIIVALMNVKPNTSIGPPLAWKNSFCVCSLKQVAMPLVP